MRSVVLLLSIWLGIGTSSADSAATAVSLGQHRDRVAADLILAGAGEDSAALYKYASAKGKAALLKAFWADRNPLVYRYYYGSLLGERTYRVSHAWLNHHDLIPRPFVTVSSAPDSPHLAEACLVITDIIRALPTDTAARRALGYLRLEQGRCDEAAIHFSRLPDLNEADPEAHNGRGLIHLCEADYTSALERFHQAALLDSTASGPLYNQAVTLLASGSPDARSRFSEISTRFPDHDDAAYKLGVFHQRSRDLVQAVASFDRQLQSNPSHLQAASRRLRAYLELQRLGHRPLTYATIRARAKSDPLAYLPLLAEYHLQDTRLKAAWNTYVQYLRLLPEQERSLYDDIRPLLSPSSQAHWDTMSVEERTLIRKGYWILTDPTPTSEFNESRIEHYRRVTYARTVLGNTAGHWDERGEIYVRFGHPHLRCVRGYLPDEYSMSVLKYKQKFNWVIAANEAASRELARSRQNRRRESAPKTRVEKLDLDDTYGLSAVRYRSRGKCEQGFPLPAETDWESWIYVDLDGGIELTWYDRTGSGSFTLADTPSESPNPRFWDQLSPRKRIDRLIQSRPTRRRFETLSRVRFHYVSAQYGASEKKTRLDIHVDVPKDPAAVSGLSSTVTTVDSGFDSLRSRASLTQETRIYNARWDLVYKDIRDLHRHGYRLDDRIIGSLNVELIPGQHFLVIEIRDGRTGDFQFYRTYKQIQRFEPEELNISSLLLARDIANDTETAPSASEGFTHNQLNVIPEPRQIYAMGRPIYVYYEVYGLERDEFGETHFTIEYEVNGTHELETHPEAGIRPEPRWAGRSGSSVRPSYEHLLRRVATEKSISLSYEHKGTTSEEQMYIALHEIAPPEPDVLNLKVTVTDLNSGKRKVQRSIGFGVTD